MQNASAFMWGGVIAILGGLIGLGGAEFRLPVLVGVFKYPTLQAVILNLAVSLVTVVFSLVFRMGLTNFGPIIGNGGIILNILIGSLIGAYLGVNFASRVNERVLTRVVASFLLALSIVLISHTFISNLPALQMPAFWRMAGGVLMGVVIGVFSSMLGVAGGELIIPTIVLLFSVDIKLAGSLSLVISIPTIVMGLVKYQRKLDGIRTNRTFLLWMAIGSIVGALIGSYLLRFVSSSLLYILLGLILFISALRLATHQETRSVVST